MVKVCRYLHLLLKESAYFSNFCENFVKFVVILKFRVESTLIKMLTKFHLKMIVHLITNKAHPTLSHKIYYSRQVDCELVTGRGTIHSL